MYVQWDTVTERVTSPIMETKPVHGYGYYPCLLPTNAHPSPEHSVVWELQDIEGVQYVVGSWSGPDTFNVATRDQINRRHRELETSPITVFGELFDCDERSEVRMRDAIAFWDTRPLEPNVFEEREFADSTEKVIIWTRGDNTLVELRKSDLIAIYDEMLKQRALRGSILFAALRRLKSDPATTRTMLDDLSQWGLEVVDTAE